MTKQIGRPIGDVMKYAKYTIHKNIDKFVWLSAIFFFWGKNSICRIYFSYDGIDEDLLICGSAPHTSIRLEFRLSLEVSSTLKWITLKSKYILFERARARMFSVKLGFGVLRQRMKNGQMILFSSKFCVAVAQSQNYKYFSVKV